MISFFLLNLSSGSALNDGQWHSVRFVAKENFAMLTVDGEEASAVRSTSALVINTGGTYHLGGEGQHNTVDAARLECSHSSAQQAGVKMSTSLVGESKEK